MKKYPGFILAAIIALGATACKSEGNSEIGDIADIADISIEASETSAAPKRGNIRINYTREEAIEIIEKSRFSASEDFFADIPKSIDHVSTFYCGKLGETQSPVFPAWKISLYNPTESRVYGCYVNALNSEFEYYKE